MAAIPLILVIVIIELSGGVFGDMNNSNSSSLNSGSSKSSNDGSDSGNSNQGGSDSDSKDSSDSGTVDDGRELPSDISFYDIRELCERGFREAGKRGANISITNHYAMGYPLYTYVIVGKLSSGSQQLGLSQCQVDWKTWSVKSLMIDGQQL